MSSEPSIGDLIAGKYRLDAIVGRGGMGVVYRATDTTLGRNVAIKVVQGRLAESRSDAVTRLRREAKLVARLESHHVAQIYEVAELDDGLPAIVMEFLEGEDLGAHVERAGPLSPERAVDWLLQACIALAEAHAEGMVHRDLKPSNLFLCERRDGTRMVKVLDFGIAKPLNDEDKTLTGTSDVMGSVPYMSPEQLRASRFVTARTDLWSLGATLFYLLTARGPHEGTTSHAIAAAILHDEPLSLAACRPDLPSELGDVVAACLRRDPQKRVPSVATLAALLSPWGSDVARDAAARIAHFESADASTTTLSGFDAFAEPTDATETEPSDPDSSDPDSGETDPSDTAPKSVASIPPDEEIDPVADTQLSATRDTSPASPSRRWLAFVALPPVLLGAWYAIAPAASVTPLRHPPLVVLGPVVPPASASATPAAPAATATATAAAPPDSDPTSAVQRPGPPPPPAAAPSPGPPSPLPTASGDCPDPQCSRK